MIRTPDLSKTYDLLSGRRLGKGRGLRLLHFMTGGCVNCQRLTVKLKATALPDGVELVTIHTGKFARERDGAYVSALAGRYGLRGPLLNDARGELAEAFALKAWPTLILVDEKGYERARAVGEGALEAIFGSLEAKGSPSVETAPLDTACGFESLAVAAGPEVLVCDYEGNVTTRLGGFAEARGVAWEGKTLYVSDRIAGEVVAIEPSGRRKSIVSGLRSPCGLTVKEGIVYAAESGAHRIVALYEGKARPVAGIGYEGVKEGDALKEAMLAQPSDLAWLDDALYCVDAEGSAMRKIADGRVETPVGWDLFTFGDCDGVGEAVRLQHPEGLCSGVGGCGNHRLFIGDTFNGKIKAFDPLTGRVITVAEGLSEPRGLCKQGCALYIADAAFWGIVRLDLQHFDLERIPFR